MNKKAADNTVAHDTGWVLDGHHICWNGPYGAFMGHPDHCPYYTENKMRVYLCSPGCYAAANGLSLDDMPENDAKACREFSHGSEPIRWRLQEIIHPDLTIEEQTSLSIFQVMLDVEDEFE
jgi:hypothetical protein